MQSPPSESSDESSSKQMNKSPVDLNSLMKDRRYSYAIKDIGLGNDLEDDQLEKALSRTVMERQAEVRKERTDAIIMKYREKEFELQQRRLFYRFKAMVRIIIMASSLKNYGTDYFERLQGVERTVEPSTALPAFDVNYYRRKKQTLVPSQVKRMMAKPSWLRTEEELTLIFRTLCQLNFFNKYPRGTLRSMAPVINYSHIEPNRVVLRQGHMPLNFYFVLSGTLLVYVDVKDQAGNPKSLQVGKLEHGASFGELALIHNTPRTATVITQFASELLSLERDDFNELLKDAAQHKWLGIYNALSQLDEFASWTKEEREHCSNNCKMIKYDHNKVIVGNVQGRPEHLYFVVDGQCRVVEALRFLTSPNKTSGGLVLCPFKQTNEKSKDGTCNQPPWSSVVRRYLHIMTIEKGQYFGAGEDLRSRYVVASGAIECLQISHAYLRRSGRASWAELLEDRLLTVVPTHKYVYNEFVERATWRTYKKGLMADLVIRTKKSTVATLKDVPESIRRSEEVENWNTIQIN